MSRSRYIQVANAIAHEIDSGRLKERDALPPERALSESYNVSRETVRKAIKLLANRGYLASRHGRGTFVAPDQLRNMHRSIDGWTDEARRNGRKASQVVLGLEEVAPPEVVARALDLEKGTPVLRLQRLRHLDGNPVGLHDSYLKLKPAARLSLDRIRHAGSLYAVIAQDFGLVLTDATESISAVHASQEEARLLEIPRDTPLLRIERITVSENLEPVEFCEMKYNQNYKYDTVVRRSGIRQWYTESTPTGKENK